MVIRAIIFTFISLLFFGNEIAGAQAHSKKTEVLDSLRLKEGDEAQNDMRALKTEMLVSKSESLAIQQVQKLIKKYKGMEVEADLQLRLAELYMRKAKTDRFFELNRESDVVVNLAQKKISGASSKKAIMDAISIYDYIERKFPKYDKIDEVIFNNAFARQQIGQDKVAEEKYWRVINKYSYSFLVPDSHLAIGEMTFKQRRFQHALDHFNAIKKYPMSRVYPYGLYKGAWTLYNLRQTELAMKALEQVVEYGKRVEAEGLDVRLDLRKEALTDMTLFYSELYPAKKAYRYFMSQAKREEVGELLLKLARIYDRHSLYENKDIVLRDYILDNPKNILVPTIYDQLVWNYENMKNRDKAIKQLKDFSLICKKSSKWSSHHLALNMESEVSNCNELFRSTSIKLAQKWLQIWEKNLSFFEFADSSERAFELYLEDNSDLIKSDKARFSLAQLQFKRDKFRSSLENYEKVGRSTQDKELGHDSRYGAIVSLEKSIGKGSWNDKDEKHLHSLVQLYIEHHPDGVYRLDIEFKLALIYYDKSKYDLAAPIFLNLGERFKTNEKGIKAQDLYLDILNTKKDFVGLQKYSKSLMGNGADQSRKQKLNLIYEQAYFLEVQSFEERGKVLEAITKYKDFVAENPKSELAEKAAWNVIQLYFQIMDFKGGADASHEFAQKFPKSNNAIPALLKAAHAYEELADLKKVTEVLLKLSQVDKDNHLKWKNLSADFFYIQGTITVAENIYRQVYQERDSKHSQYALVQMEKIQNKSGSSEHLNLLQKLIKENIQPEASHAQLFLVEKLWQEKKSQEAFSEAMKLLNMNKEASQYAKAKARFIQAQILDEEFDRQSVKSQIDRFTTVFAIKTEKLEKAQQAYQSAIRYGDPKVAVQALVHLSKLYEKYVKTLKQMPIPGGLPESEVASFKLEMEKLAMPMEEKGVDTMAEALSQAKRLKFRDGTIAKVQVELDRLNMINNKTEVLPLVPPRILLPKYFKKVVGR